MPKMKILMIVSGILLWSAVSFEPAAGQEAPPDGFVQQAEALREKLDGWRDALNGLNFDQLAVDNEEPRLLQELKGDRENCLEWLKTLSAAVTSFEKQSTLSRRTLIVLDIVFLQNGLGKFVSDLSLANTSGKGLGYKPDDMSPLLRWQGEVISMSSQLQGSYENLELELLRRLDSVEQELVNRPTP